MRITGGVARGRPLRAPRGPKVRPTADKVRGAIFNILATRIDVADQRWLDLFAGSGALGLEALSRGAAWVLFVDESRDSCRVIRENLERSGFASRGEARRLMLPQGLRSVARSGLRFHGSFVDPPYRRGLCPATLDGLGDGTLLLPDALVVVEHGSDETLAERYGRLQRTDTRRYGSTAISLYANVEDP
ncbi:MAG: 16S rRNA (guanine(966)-N(2))-methyltransferase RsmD [Deltaproteobacteria bacterium]|nr:16S rRNA (guanine(966)-N(2))-methyltransferase RsmD [Deltaproteobacteria bacterium]